MAPSAGKVPPEKLRWRCDPAQFGVESTAELERDTKVIGQDRALQALKLGVEVSSPGYNVFVSGLSGTGRMTAVKRLLQDLSEKCVDVPDKGYVHNFDDPARPILLELTRGRLRRFAQVWEEFLGGLREGLNALFEDQDFVAQRRRLEESAEHNQQARFDELAEECRLAGLALVQRKEGTLVRPSLAIPVGKELFPLQALARLVKQGKVESEREPGLKEKAKELRTKLDQIILESRRALRELIEELEGFDQEQAQATFESELAEIRDEFPEDCIQQHLERVEAAIIEALPLFAPSLEDAAAAAQIAFLRTLDVNPLLDNADRNDTPVIIESSPSHTNLFGTVEYRVSTSGEVQTDHMQIRAGSLVQADGGYLILSVDDLLNDAKVWQTLKRTLKFEQLELQTPRALFGPIPLLFKPQPIPLRVKVILIGNARQYSILHAYDPDFRKTFKVRADFDSEMERSADNIRRYAAFVRNLAEDEDLLPFGADALAAIVEDGARRADHGGKLSTRFSEIADLTRESQHFAVTEGAAQVGASHVAQALAAARARDDLYDEKLRERILEDSILIDTQDECVGQVNALTVYHSGQYAFGKPARITATLSAGDVGIVNVEREVNLSGDIHDKGVMILNGFLRERFGQSHPLALAASLCFEQSYGGVDGDSASSTELYALLSALADAPLRQTLAVTGSINQKGDIQPIGGVNEKITGFFEICQQRGLDGSHGVLIPWQNVSDLMLPEEIVKAVEDGQFTVYSVAHVDEGIELLTGVPAGTRGEDGHYPPDSINGRVAARLYHMAEVARDNRAAAGDGEHGHGDEHDHGAKKDDDPPAPSPDDQETRGQAAG